jgi:DNA mismatch repair enzyme (predicted ATPase)
MNVIDLPPVASTLLEAMRAVGYSFETAMADIIDNSITAGSTEIDVLFSAYGEPYVSVVDNGEGMDAAQLRIAMRHGSRNPLAERAADDLGRFGLGLKTATLSQCRQLTVVSLKSGVMSGAIWDLDEVIERQAWALLELDADDIRKIPDIDRLEKHERGTLVVWQKLDRVFAGEVAVARALQDRIDDTRTHLGLVFHRFLESSAGRSPLSIRINNVPVSASDPYLRGTKGWQLLPRETLIVDGHCVEVEAHILPHISRLSADEIVKAGGDEGLRRNQGFYVYRNRRLIIWGTWFRLAKQEEMTKLARVMVDIPNALDHLWTLDIKKSAAHPPEVVRQGLRRIVDRIADRSKRVYTHRGWKANEKSVVHAWERVEHRGGSVSYRINREHDLFNALRSGIAEEQTRFLELFLQAIEQSFPFDSLYADMASERRVGEERDDDDVEELLLDTALLMLDAVGRGTQAAARLKERLHLLDPFAQHLHIVEKIDRKSVV